MAKTATKITGTKTPTEQKAAIAKRAAKPHGGKPGQAMLNQSAQYVADADTKAEITKEAKSRAKAHKGATIETPVKGGSDKITIIDMPNVNGGKLGESYIRVAAGDTEIIIPRTRFVPELKALAVKGASLKAVRDYMTTHKPNAKLASGITGRDAPHASKAVGDAKAAPAKVTAEKSKKAVTTRGEKTYVSTAKEDTSKPDSFRRYMISTIRAHKDTGAAKAAHAKSGKFNHERLNFNWAAANGYIAFN